MANLKILHPVTTKGKWNLSTQKVNLARKFRDKNKFKKKKKWHEYFSGCTLAGEAADKLNCPKHCRIITSLWMTEFITIIKHPKYKRNTQKRQNIIIIKTVIVIIAYMKSKYFTTGLLIPIKAVLFTAELAWTQNSTFIFWISDQGLEQIFSPHNINNIFYKWGEWMKIW